MERILRSGPLQVLFDSALDPQPEAGWFHPDWWRNRNAVITELGGRGQALAVDSPLGEAVLRVYHRGGMVRHLSTSSYLYTGADRTRPFAEWRVTRRLLDAGIPVPEPLAAAFERHGPIYRPLYSGALLTRRIPDAEPLPKAADRMGSADWKNLGKLVARAAAAGMRHPDLNADNILFDTDGRFWLLDFDRVRMVGNAVDPDPMIRRLQRSMRKLGIEHDESALRNVVRK
ncbi:MAG: 3-deoxy-D-manno-octulosonic acid kinase [Wenzhouxiangellaceae bacterium]